MHAYLPELVMWPICVCFFQSSPLNIHPFILVRVRVLCAKSCFLFGEKVLVL